MTKCFRCEREFRQNRPWQEFCSKECQQAWNREKYRHEKYAAAVEKVEDRVRERELRKNGEEFIKFDTKEMLEELGFVTHREPLRRRV